MYDLTVEDVHTFAVGDGDWVVHNCSDYDPAIQQWEDDGGSIEDSNRNFIRVRHYTNKTRDIRYQMALGGITPSGEHVTEIAVEYPIDPSVTDHQARYDYFRPTGLDFMEHRRLIDGYVEFNIDQNVWITEVDLHSPDNLNSPTGGTALVINLAENAMAQGNVNILSDGFRLDAPGVRPVFYDKNGVRLR